MSENLHEQPGARAPKPTRPRLVTADDAPPPTAPARPSTGDPGGPTPSAPILLAW